MKRILKIGDAVYAQSIQKFAPSYITGFPQREQFIAQFAKNVAFSFYRHKPLLDIAAIEKEQAKLKAYLKDKTFDYLMVDNPLSGLLVSDSIKTPLLFDCIDWYEEMYLQEFGIDKRFYLLKYGMLHLLDYADAVIAQSPVILDALQLWGLKTDRYTVLPNGYDSSLFKTYSPKEIELQKQRIAKRLKVPFKNKQLIVYAGKLGRWYENIKLISESISDQQLFLIVGDGPIIDEIPESPNIIKCGPVPLQEVPNYTNIADVLVFPVDVDCSPIAISEYLAVGKPIVMGRGRMEWLLQDGITGSMVDNNPYAWRQGIERAFAYKDKISQHNLKLAKDLSWQKLATKFTNFLEGEDA